MGMLYQVGIDGDDDGFICWDTQAGDGLNLMPWAVSHAGLQKSTISGAAYDEVVAATAYGSRYYRVVTGTNTFSSFDLGRDGGGVIDDIPVDASTEYTLVVWARGVSNYAGVPFFIRAENQAGTYWGAQSISLSGDWQQFSSTATTDSGSTHTLLEILKGNSAANVTFDCAGFMLVAGDTAPAAFNAGDVSNFSDAGWNHLVTRLEWRRGLAEAYDVMAAPGWARVTVKNDTQVFSPEIGGGMGLERGRRLKIRTVDGDGTIVEQFTGHIAHVEPEAGEFGKRGAVIHAFTADAQLREYIVRVPPQVGVATGAIIGEILDRVPLRRQVLKDVWILGVGGQSELGRTTILPGVTAPRELDSGRTTLAYVGDNWDDGIRASDAIEQVAGAERGRFYVDGEGMIRYLDRHRVLTALAVQHTFRDDMDGLEYGYGGDYVQAVRVKMVPRKLDTVETIIWTLASSQVVRSGRVLRVVARFRDGDGRAVGAVAVSETVSYAANTQADGGGTDFTDRVEVVVVQVDFSAAVLEVQNRAGRDVWLLAGATIAGVAVHQGDPVTMEQVGERQGALYGLRTVTLALPAVSDVEDADNIARFELGRRKQPRGVMREMRLRHRRHLAQVVERRLFDRIRVEETQTGHSADYFIVGQHNAVDLAGLRHDATWLLEAAAANRYWLLDVALLGIDTVVAY